MSFFFQPGTFTVTIEAVNPIHSVSVAVDVELIEPVKDIRIDDNDLIVGEGQEKSFSISFGIIGNMSCIAVNYGDSFIELYGHDQICMSSVYNDTATFIGHHSNPLLVKHVYSVAGSYDMEVHGFNALSSEVAKLVCVISTVNCFNPRVDIKDRKDKFWDPIKVHKSSRLNVIGISFIKCHYTLKNMKKWKIKQIDQNTGAIVKDVDIDVVPSSTSAELVLSHNFLDIGLFAVYYSITMDPSEFSNGEVYYGETKTFIEIVKSALVVRMFPGGITRVRLGASTTYSISPDNYSYDPDLPTGSIQVCLLRFSHLYFI